MSIGTILLVDDDVAMCKDMEDILSDRGYSAFSAFTYADGIKLGREKRPQVVFLDIRLPDESGLKLLIDLKKELPECVFIILTAYADLESAVSAIEEGAFRYLQKPVNPTDILHLLELIFEMIRLREDKRHADEALLESESRLKTIFDTVQAGIVIIDAETRLIVDANPAALAMIGAGKDRVIGSVCHKFICPAEEGRCPVCDLENEIDMSERILLTINGEPVPIIKSVVKVILGGRLHLLENIISIADRLKAEKALKESEERFRALIEQAGDAMFLIEPSSKLVDVNNCACDVLGYSREELLSMNVTDIEVGLPKDEFMEFVKMLKKNVPVTTDGIHRKKDGSTFPVEVRTGLVEIKGKLHLLSLARDISERKMAEESIRISEEKFSKAFRSSPILMSISTLKEGLYTEVNDAFLDASGYERENVIGHTALELNIWSDMAERDLFVKQLQQHGIIYSRETIMRNKSGELLDVLLSAEMIDMGGEPSILAVILDISDRKKLENQLLHSQKMEAIGQLAGGIAHDFNNIISAIIGYGQLIKMELKEGDPIKGPIGHILASSDRAANLVQSLLAFSRKQTIKARPADLNEIVRGVENLLSRLIGEDIELKTLFNSLPPPFETEGLTALVDPGQIEQTLLNLATNARDAMPAGGMLTIETGCIQIDEHFIKKHAYGKPGTYAYIGVTDTGSGMDKQTVEKIFEPFFTTKEKRKGTGLGLAMVYGIIKQHKGYINVSSELNIGTTFTLYLPVTRAKADDVAATEQKIDVARSKGGEVVLVAEDDENLRIFMKTILMKYGYQVIEASDGQEAIDRFNENKDRIDLLISDLIMPRKNGNEVCQEIRKIKPDIKTIILSGYDDNMLQEKKIVDKDITFISKPVYPVPLLSKVRDVLEGKK